MFITFYMAFITKIPSLQNVTDN